jgi:hypothetical protein
MLRLLNRDNVRRVIRPAFLVYFAIAEAWENTRNDEEEESQTSMAGLNARFDIATFGKGTCTLIKVRLAIEPDLWRHGHKIPPALHCRLESTGGVLRWRLSRAGACIFRYCW